MGSLWRQRQHQPNTSPLEHHRRVRWDFATLVAVGNLLRLLAAPTKGVVLGRLLLPPSNLATTLNHFSRKEISIVPTNASRRISRTLSGKGRLDFSEHPQWRSKVIGRTHLSPIAMPCYNFLPPLGRGAVGSTRDFGSRGPWFEARRPSHLPPPSATIKGCPSL